MTENSHIFLSNRVEILYDRLVSSLFPGSSPFERRLIIVPSPAMKSWLTLRMAQDPQLEICTGVEIHYLEEGLNLLQKECIASKASSYAPSSLDLAIQLEVQMKKILTNYHLLPLDEQATWKELADYIKVKPGYPLNQRSERRLVSLSEKLAHLFKQYGRYGAEMIERWENIPGSNWQAHLWNRLFATPEFNWTYPYRDYTQNTDISDIGPLQLHLFAISYLSTLQFSFLQKFSEKYSYHHYLLSPCCMFWSDMRSDRERVSIVNNWMKKGLSEGQKQDLEELLRDRNPLLANFGRLGREMVLQIEESQHLSEELYIAPKSLMDNEEYRDLYHEVIELHDKQSKLSLLEAVQADMLMMRTPTKSETIELHSDRSIHVHIAPNKLREVEILYNNLLTIIDAHSQEEHPISPSDIVVLAPDIADYQPYIQAVFGSKESLLDYQLMDLKAPIQSRLIQTFIYLLNLPLSKWDAKVVIELFEFPQFHKKHGFSIDDIHTLRTWVKETKIRWGNDTEHRDEILENSHCLRGMIDKSPYGTWESGFTNLIHSLVYKYDGEDGSLFSRNVDIGTTQTEILGKVIHLVRSLRDDLSLLYSNTLMTLEEWGDYLICILQSYLYDDENDRESMALLKRKIEQLGQSGKWVKGAKFSFSTVKKHLLTALEQQHTCYRENHVQSVRFCSMLPMRAIPSRVVSIIGMEEGAFPKRDLDISLNMMRGNEQCDYCPSQVDYDRYLFLEILLSARDHLLLSHSSLTLEEDTEQPPSLMISELMNYLDDNFRVDGHLPSEYCTTHHPYRNFDASYFTEKPLDNYSIAAYQAAQCFYSSTKTPPHQFIEDFETICIPPETDHSPTFIDVADLSQCMKNPLKLYFNKTLGVYIKNFEDSKLQTEENFTLTSLDSSTIKKSALKYSPEEIMEKAAKEGILPMGLFKEVAEQRSYSDIANVHSILKKLSVTSDDITSIILTEECDVPHKDEENRWVLPPITADAGDKQFVITGTIPNVSQKGLFAYAEDSPEGIIKSWAEFVIFGCAIHRHKLPLTWSFIPIKTEKCVEKSSGSLDPEILLLHILDLYQCSLASPSPLIPEWSIDILQGEEKQLEEKMRSSLHNAFKPIYNDYIEWSVNSKILPSSKMMIDHWQEHAKNKLNPIYKAWFPKKLTEVE